MDLFWQIYFDLDRVGHIVAGVTWIGILYYLNFAQVPAFAKMDPAARANAIQVLVPQVLFLFRWAAFFTVLFGLGFIIGKGVQDHNYFETTRFYSVAIGGVMGLIMAGNVWFIIWPNQKKVIAAVSAGEAPDPSWARKTLLASRTNTMLSVPMIFFMAAAIHLPALWN